MTTLTMRGLLTAVLLATASAVFAGDGQAGPAVPSGAAQPAETPAEWTKSIPLTFSVNYALASDYVFRGINFSEYAGEGREDLNHQLGVGVEYDTGKFGIFGATAWFEWYAGQENLTSGYGGNNQEIDYALYWKYAVPDLATTVEAGWIAYTFPPFGGDAHTSYEVYLKLYFDDSGLWKTDKPVLNPYVAYYHDLDLAENGSWWELGVSHPFAMADYCPDAPILKNVTITPSVVLGVDHRYCERILACGHPSTRLANINYGLDISYDLSGALKLPPRFGKLAVGGFLNFSQALYDEVIDDEFYGGLKLSYAW